MTHHGHPTHLWQITAPHFCAGIITTNGICTEAAPILAWTIGKSRQELREYFTRRTWLVKRIATEIKPAENRP